MKKFDVVKTILGNRLDAPIKKAYAKAFAPSNIALCKYWGKRNQELNLPMTSSLSISLGKKGVTTEVTVIDSHCDVIHLNNTPIDLFSPFGKRLLEFLSLFRKTEDFHFEINIQSNIPIAAGLASSASGFAAFVLVLNDLFAWNLPKKDLSILARLGSGSASRSIWDGFVEWHVGVREDGLDSHGESILETWPDLCVGLLILNDKEKSISSKEAMQRTVTTSGLYSAWPSKVNKDLSFLKQAITMRDFELFGKTAESNALTMHAMMQSAWPPIIYTLPETLYAMQKIWELRREGLALYFTQDAGPNLKLLFLKNDIETIHNHFPTMDAIDIFK